MGYYIVAFEQNGGGRTVRIQRIVAEEIRVNTKNKGLTERRLLEFRRMYQASPYL